MLNRLKKYVPRNVWLRLGAIVYFPQGRFYATAVWFRRLIYQRLFYLWERCGFHITPANFGSTIPELGKLPDEVFTRRSALAGIEMNETCQVALVQELGTRFKEELAVFEQPTKSPWDYSLFESSAFPPVDAQILYYMVRSFSPRRYYEFGAGKTTCIAAKAALLNEQETGRKTEVVALDPYPSAILRKGFPGLTRLVEQKAEDIPISYFCEMQEGDIVLIDSTHHMRIGSDVQYLFLEVLPRLPKGTLVHVHDIFLPAEYPRLWIKEWKVFPNEQYLFHAFLLHNSAWKVLWASHFMHLKHPRELSKTFAGYDPLVQGPGSFWIQRVAE